MLGIVRLGQSSRLVVLAVAHTLLTTTSCCFQLRGTEASGPGLASPASVASLLRQRTGREAASITLGLSALTPTTPSLVRGTEVGAGIMPVTGGR